MPTLIIAEKPSVARGIADAVGAHERRDGYIEGGGYLISWCRGHIIDLDFPQNYPQWSGHWSMSQQPMLPERWRWSVTAPEQYMGDILGDLNKRRGRVMGMTRTGDGEQIIEAECPEAELMSYAIDLRSMTQSRGSFTMHFVRYEQCSADAQEKAVAAAKALQEAE